jgi:hypothetical protein
MCGLRMEDTKNMTLGMRVDYIIEWNNIHFPVKQSTNCRATQKDFDRF